MIKNNKQTHTNTLRALYSYAMIELDSYIKVLKEMETTLEKANHDLDAILGSSSRISGLEKYVEELLMNHFYQAKNYIFIVRKNVKKYLKRLELFFVHNYDKKVLFDEKLDEIATLAKEREFYVDHQIEKCIDYIGEYQKL